MNVDLIAFWFFLATIVVCVTWAGHLGRLETERTIRHAIDKGVAVDAAFIDRLRRAAGMPWRPRLVAWGIVTASVAGAVTVFALFNSIQEPESLMPLLGIAAFFAVIAAGLVGCGLWLGREFDRAAR